MLLERDVDLPTLLQHIVDEARSMIGARSAVLTLARDHGTGFTEFTSQTVPEDRRGADQGAADLRGAAVLEVPIRVREEVYGHLHLVEKEDSADFTKEDDILIEALALGAGIAIENTRSHERAKQLALYEERDRLARDLHDSVIQRLFAAGLTLQAVLTRVSDQSLSDQVRLAVDEVDASIQEIRSSIFQLHRLGGREPGLCSRIGTLVDELASVTGAEIRAELDKAIDTEVSSHVAAHLLATLREVLTNVGRHADASQVVVAAKVEGPMCILTVADNGRGFDTKNLGSGGLGLSNLRRRAEILHGSLTVDSVPDGGTTLVWRARSSPLENEA